MSKAQNLLLLTPTIKAAGGFYEAPIIVESVAHGEELLDAGWVVKMEYGSRGQYVYKRNDEEDKAQFKEHYSKSYASKIKFFAVRYNPDLLDRGEVRVYMAFGQFLQMMHTAPHADDIQQKRLPNYKWKGMSAENCYGQLRLVEEIQ